MKVAVAVIIATIWSCVGAAAQDTAPFDASAYPAGVQKVLQSARDECKAQGGGKVQFAADTIRALDLTGAGRNDYIIDLRNAECADIASAYCGTGGCRLSIVVTLHNGDTRLVMDEYVREYKVLPGSDPRTILFNLHGSFCGGFGSQLCIKRHRITAQPFKLSDREGSGQIR